MKLGAVEWESTGDRDGDGDGRNNRGPRTGSFRVPNPVWRKLVTPQGARASEPCPLRYSVVSLFSAVAITERKGDYFGYSGPPRTGSTPPQGRPAALSLLKMANVSRMHDQPQKSNKPPLPQPI